MKSIRIAHFADFHLGGKLNERNELSEQINKNLVKTLYEIFKVLQSSKVDLVLIAGDFYESSNTNEVLLNQVKEIFNEFSGKIVISPGNHDYFSLDSVYNEKWPENTYIFKSENIEYFQFDDLNTRVYGFAFLRSHIEDVKIRELNNIDDSYINIGVFHGQIDTINNMYHPIFIEDIEKSNLDYIALGHIHKRSEIKKVGNTYYAYSGNPVGRGFDETGQKGIYLGDISKDRNGLHFYKIDNSEFHIVEVDINIFESQIITANTMREKLIDLFGNSYKNNYYRIILKGYIKKDSVVNIDIISSILSDIKYIEIIDQTNLYIDKDEISKEDSLRKRFLDLVLEDSLSKEDEEKIINYGIRAFEDIL